MVDDFGKCFPMLTTFKALFPMIIPQEISGFLQKSAEDIKVIFLNIIVAYGFFISAMTT